MFGRTIPDEEVINLGWKVSMTRNDRMEQHSQPLRVRYLTCMVRIG